MVDLGEGRKEGVARYRLPYFRLSNRTETKDLFPLKVPLKPVKMGV